MSKIAIITDAWYPQTNGVVRSLDETRKELEFKGHEVKMITPDLTSVFCFGLPSYKEIKVELFARQRIAREMAEFQPDFVHISTEGPMGVVGRRWCLDNSRPFTTAFHTSFPEYLSARIGGGSGKWLGVDVEKKAYDFLRWFHDPSSAIMVSTPTIQAQLESKGFKNILRWSRGVDSEQFRIYGKDLPAYRDLPRPILLYMGRVALEKNLEAFLSLDTPGSKVVVGGGPAQAPLQAKFPKTLFTGPKKGEELGRLVAGADIFVFPSKTDTFGLVLLEALSCGLGVAAYPVAGPIDVIDRAATRNFARLDPDLGNAVRELTAMYEAGKIDQEGARAYASRYTWSASADQFYRNLQLLTPEASARVRRKAASRILRHLGM